MLYKKECSRFFGDAMLADIITNYKQALYLVTVIKIYIYTHGTMETLHHTMLLKIFDLTFPHALFYFTCWFFISSMLYKIKLNLKSWLSELSVMHIFKGFANPCLNIYWNLLSDIITLSCSLSRRLQKITCN